MKYEYSAQGRPRFGVSLGLFVDCLNTFSVPGHSSLIEIRYPGPDMELLLKYVHISLLYLSYCNLKCQDSNYSHLGLKEDKMPTN